MSQTGKLKLKFYHFDDDYFEFQFICLKQFKNENVSYLIAIGTPFAIVG